MPPEHPPATSAPQPTPSAVAGGSPLPSERRYADLVNSIEGIVWEADPATLRLTFVSRQAEPILGYPLEAWLESPTFWEDHVHPEDREATVRRFRDAVARGESPDLLYRMITADGQLRWVRDLVKVEARHGTPVMIRGVMVDITPLVRAEQDLRRERERLAGILHGTRAGTWEWNVQTGETVFNERWAEIIGYTLAELEPVSITTWTSLAHPDDLASSGDLLERHFRGELPYYDCECRMRHRDGHWVWVHDRGAVMEWTEDGRPLRMAGTHIDVSDRIANQEALRRLSLVASQTTNGVVIADAQGRVEWINEGFTRISGFTLEEMRGRSPGSLLHGADTDRDAVARIRAALRAREPFTEELLNYRRDGQPYWVRIACNPLFEDDGSLRGFMAVETDVTEHRRAEEALRASEALLERTGQVAKVGGWELDLAEMVPRWTSETRRLHDVAPDYQPTLESALSFYAPEARPVIERAVQAAIAHGTPWDVEVPVITATGRRIWVRVVGQAQWEGGRVRRLYGAFQDITDRRRQEEEMRASRERFMLAVSGAQDGIWDWDLRDNSIFLSPRWKAILGFADDELPSAWSSWADLLHPEDREPTLATLDRYLRGELPAYHAEFRMRHRNGAWVWILARGQALRDEHGTPYRMAGSHTDITERKRAEQEREQLQARLVQADKMESVGRLAGGVAHDFNNMLSVILGNATLALEGLDPRSPLYEPLVEIRSAAERSADLTRQLLGFSRRQTAAPRVLDLNDAVAGILTMLRRLVGEEIALAWMPGPGLWPIRMDPAQLHQILTNLVVNARDAIAGLGRIAIETRNAVLDEAYCLQQPGLVPGDYVTLAVSDTGSGMGPEVVAHIFEPFFTTKVMGHGTGLGLATVYGIVRQNGGTITVYSEPGGGSTFRLHFPRSSTAVADLPDAAEEALPRGAGETVLLVEDEAALLRLGRSMLEALGYQVLVANSPDEALRVASAHPGEIDLLVTDVVMPEMNGRDLATRLAALRPLMACLFMSGYTADVIANRGVLEEGAQFLSKPFSRMELATAVRAAIERRAQGSR